MPLPEIEPGILVSEDSEKSLRRSSAKKFQGNQKFFSFLALLHDKSHSFLLFCVSALGLHQSHVFVFSIS